VLFVNDKVPASNLKELMTYAKANQGKLNIGDFGSLGTVQLLIDQMSESADLKLTQIPYKGGTDMTTGLVADDIQMMFAGIGPAMPFVESGKLKAIAIAQDERSPLMPDLPTFREAGMPMVSVVSYVAIFARAGTPEPVLQKLREVVAEVVKSKEFHARVTPLGVDPWTIPPADLAAFVEKDFAQWKSRPVTSRPYDK
jgi:tripartite-type tricarboxylate transporter receptor subunit TctC